MSISKEDTLCVDVQLGYPPFLQKYFQHDFEVKKVNIH